MNQILEIAARYGEDLRDLPVFPAVDETSLRDALTVFDFAEPVTEATAIEFAAKGMREALLQTSHPAYFGVFNPRPTAMGIAGEWLTALFNPQLASWISAPFAVELEQHVLSWWANKFSFPADCDRTFTNGGMEANHSALLIALTKAFPEFAKKGAAALGKRPRLYVSTETHHSFLKAARLCGIGTEAVRELPVDAKLRLRGETVARAIAEDRAKGEAPFLIVGTAGSTSAGVIDELREIAAVAADEGIWFHVDAAWGGAAILVPELVSALDGIQAADSLTLDAHKWLSVPMTGGIFLSRHHGIMDATFRIDASPYMPHDSSTKERHQPYHETMAWSRRFLGLKLFLSMAASGESGYRDRIRHQTAMGDELRTLLSDSDWRVVNDTPLPVVCFVEKDRPEPDAARVEALAKLVADSRRTWITTTTIAGRPVWRAGISNFSTQSSDLRVLIDTLDRARASLPA